MNKRWIQLGIVGKAHGLNGAFFISSRDDLLPETVKGIRIGKDPDKAPTMKVKACRWQSDRPLVQVEELKTRDAAELICHSPIWCDRQEIDIDEDEEYFWGDLIGKQVVDPQGVKLGRIEGIQNYGASDIILIEADDGRTLEVPFVDVYFAMDFSFEDKELKLLVPADTFDEAWNPA